MFRASFLTGMTKLTFGGEDAARVRLARRLLTAGADFATLTSIVRRANGVGDGRFSDPLCLYSLSGLRSAMTHDSNLLTAVGNELLSIDFPTSNRITAS